MHKKILLALKWLIIFSLIFTTLSNKLDFDFGWHLAAGDYTRGHGVPSHDLYTYTAQSFEWINHEAINDMLMSLLYSAGGFGLLVVFYSLIWTGAFMVAAFRVRLGILLLALLATMPYMAIRPMAWTVLGLATLLWLINKGPKRLKLAIPLLFLVWANLHGGFVIGLIVLFYFLIKQRNRFWLLIFLASVLATMVNIYGPRLYEEIFRTLFDSSLRYQITEWFPLQIYKLSWPFIILWIAGFWLFSRRKRSEWYSLPPLFFLASLSATRNVPLFVIVSVNKAGEYYEQALKEIPKKPPWLPRAFTWSSAAVIYLVSIWGFYGTSAPFSVDKEDRFPKAAVAYLKKNRCQGNLFNDFNYGGYLIWKLPEQKVYIDGRMPSWRDEKGVRYLDRYRSIIKDQEKQDEEFKRYAIRCVLVRSGYVDFVKRLKDTGWKAEIESNGASLLLAP